MTSTLINKTGALEFLGAIQQFRVKESLPPNLKYIADQIDMIKQKTKSAGLEKQLRNLDNVNLDKPEFQAITASIEGIFNTVKEKFNVSYEVLDKYMEVRGYRDQTERIFIRDAKQKFGAVSNMILNQIYNTTGEKSIKEVEQVTEQFDIEKTFSQKSGHQQEENKTSEIQQDQVVNVKIDPEVIRQLVTNAPQLTSTSIRQIEEARRNKIMKTRQNIIVFVKAFVLFISYEHPLSNPLTAIITAFNKHVFDENLQYVKYFLTMQELQTIISGDHYLKELLATSREGIPVIRNRDCFLYENHLKELEILVSGMFGKTPLANSDPSVKNDIFQLIKNTLEINHNQYGYERFNKQTFTSRFSQKLNGNINETDLSKLCALLEKLDHLNLNDKCQQSLKEQLRYFTTNNTQNQFLSQLQSRIAQTPTTPKQDNQEDEVQLELQSLNNLNRRSNIQRDNNPNIRYNTPSDRSEMLSQIEFNMTPRSSQNEQNMMPRTSFRDIQSSESSQGMNLRPLYRNQQNIQNEELLRSYADNQSNARLLSSDNQSDTVIQSDRSPQLAPGEVRMQIPDNQSNYLEFGQSDRIPQQAQSQVRMSISDNQPDQFQFREADRSLRLSDLGSQSSQRGLVNNLPQRAKQRGNWFN